MHQPETFDRWLREMSPESFEDGAFIDGDWRAWLRGVYEREGPLQREAVLARARALQQELMSSGATWTRIADDLRRTADRELVLRERLDVDQLGYGWLEIEVSLDGVVIGWFQHGHSPDVEVFVAELADYLQEFALDEEIWGGWPICPEHNTHPLEATVADGTASWLCPEGRVIAPIGSLMEPQC